MKISEKYQTTLAHQRISTNIISCSWSVFYKGEYINGANYNGVGILYSLATAPHNVEPCIGQSNNIAALQLIEDYNNEKGW
jgi:hypothetical protein